ncbi:hypothetical protein C6Q21_26470 [Burkholderia multivorans]|nr:hypothetical protein C6Q21_26470 [Burkholderia multivorans]
MRSSTYVCLAAIATMLAGCLWVPGDGYRGDRGGGYGGSYGGGHESGWNQSGPSRDHMNHSGHADDQGAHGSGQREGW